MNDRGVDLMMTAMTEAAADLMWVDFLQIYFRGVTNHIAEFAEYEEMIIVSFVYVKIYCPVISDD